MSVKLSGSIEFKLENQEITLKILKLFPFLEDGELTTVDFIKTQVKELNISANLNDKLIDWYLQKSQLSNQIFTNITIACGKNPVKKNSTVLNFLQNDFYSDNTVYWEFVYNLFKNFEDIDLNQTLPFPLYYVKKGDTIATQKTTTEAINGLSLSGESVPVSRFQSNEYFSGENVHFDDNKKAFIAGSCGYVLFHENSISIYSPFHISTDKMTLSYINFERKPDLKLEKSEISSFLLKNKIDVSTLNRKINFDIPVNNPILIASGKLPGEGQDAIIEILFETETKHNEVDDNGQIDYREVKQFPSVVKDQLLAKKKLPVKGENGFDLFGNVIPAKNPKDVLLKNGLNTYKKETDEELLIFSRDDGLIEYKNGIISIFEQLHIPGDIDYSTGNINTKVNVHINGSVRTGFSVKSEKNVFIKGTIEDHCVIEAGGDLIINGGSSGSENKLSSNGNMSIKFIEGGSVYVKGNLSVQRFILSAKVECLETITVMGAGINLNEKGAIIDSEVFVRNALFCPSVGNDSGQKTFINFGFNRALNQKIKNLEETLNKITDSIKDINERFEVDITSPNIFTIIKGFAKTVKDDIITAIQEKNKLDNQFKMMSSILEKEVSKKNNELKNSSVQISKKVFPPLLLECDEAKKVIDTLQPPSKYYLDWDTKWIERSRYLTNNS